MADRLDLFAFDSMEYATADKTAVDLLGDKAEVTKDDIHNIKTFRNYQNYLLFLLF